MQDASSGSIFCWNGEAWKLDENLVQGNDTNQVFKLLLEVSSTAKHNKGEEEDYLKKMVKVLTRIAGPYAFVYYDTTHSVVWFGRDRLGRRSLVYTSTRSTDTDIVISSINFNKQLPAEVSTNGVHYIDLKGIDIQPAVVPWPDQSPSINASVPTAEESRTKVPTASVVSILQHHLEGSLSQRVLNVPTYSVAVSPLFSVPSKVAVLFSGGLDCTILARLAHDILPPEQPIDLLNVAFENPRVILAASKSASNSQSTTKNVSPYEECPDRITARSSFAELTFICPTRSWRFVAVDVPYLETLAHQSTVISLMSPHDTEMDLSITLALYFASRGQGSVVTSHGQFSTPEPYTTTARVLLSGLGADEIFGGYSRHAIAFDRTGWDGLIAELDHDFSRIGTRNLGRDDRVMGHWGREVRYPYLDEDFAAFALSLPAWEKVGFHCAQTEGKDDNLRSNSYRLQDEKVELESLDPAKLILRVMAWNLGLRRAAGEKKRAIQFGARTAKMKAGKTKGTDKLLEI